MWHKFIEIIRCDGLCVSSRVRTLTLARTKPACPVWKRDESYDPVVIISQSEYPCVQTEQDFCLFASGCPLTTKMPTLGRCRAWCGIETAAGKHLLRSVNLAYRSRPEYWHGHPLSLQTYVAGSRETRVGTSAAKPRLERCRLHIINRVDTFVV